MVEAYWPRLQEWLPAQFVQVTDAGCCRVRWASDRSVSDMPSIYVQKFGGDGADERIPLAPPVTLRTMLRAAKPTWQEADVRAVARKLDKVEIRTADELRRAVEAIGAENVNERLKARGLKAFAIETLEAMRVEGGRLLPPSPTPVQENPAPSPAPPWKWTWQESTPAPRYDPGIVRRAASGTKQGSDGLKVPEIPQISRTQENRVKDVAGKGSNDLEKQRDQINRDNAGVAEMPRAAGAAVGNSAGPIDAGGAESESAVPAFTKAGIASEADTAVFSSSSPLAPASPRDLEEDLATSGPGLSVQANEARVRDSVPDLPPLDPTPPRPAEIAPQRDVTPPPLTPNSHAGAWVAQVGKRHQEPVKEKAVTSQDRCDRGHALHKIPLPYDGDCDICGAEIDKLSLTWHCGPCAFDLCCDCHARRTQN